MAIDPNKRVVYYEIEITFPEIIKLTHSEYLEYLESLNNNQENEND